jgi:hypothetical protein
MLVYMDRGSRLLEAPWGGGGLGGLVLAAAMCEAGQGPKAGVGPLSSKAHVQGRSPTYPVSHSNMVQ